MRGLLLCVFFVFYIEASNINIKLFSDNNIEYINSLENNITKSTTTNISSDIKKEQIVYLQRLKDVSLKKISIEKFNLNNLEKNSIDLNSAFKIFEFLNAQEIKISEQIKLTDEVQTKLSFLKKLLANITEENKIHLLSYQLQFAYYKKQKSNIEKRLELLESSKTELFTLFIKNINKIVYKEKIALDKKIDDIKQKIKKLEIKKVGLSLDLEKEKIDENQKNIETILKEITKTQSALELNISSLIELFAQKAILSITNNKEDKYLEVLANLNREIEELKNDKYQKYEFILKELAKKKFGNTKLLIANSASEFKQFLITLKDKITMTLFVFNEQAISLWSMVKALLIVVIGFIIGLAYKRWLNKLSTKWNNISQMSLKIGSNVGFYFIILITIIITISSLGIDMSSISLVAGALSIGIGFGLQTVVSNFISGIIIMFERTIRIGDIIEISDLLKGTVTDIRIRSTTIKTFDNIDIVIPNSSFIQNNVINWTLEDSSRRLHIPFSVAYGTKIEYVKEIVLEKLYTSDLVFIRNEKDRTPDVRFENMNSSSLDLELLVWIKANDKKQPSSIKSDFLINIYNTLNEYKVEIPFPQMDLHIKKNK